MSAAEVAMLATAAAFLLIGIATAILMGRRGHDPWMWGVLGALFGPLVLALLVVRGRRDQAPAEQVLRPGALAPRPAALEVLVGVDGSPESLVATRAVVELLGDRVRSLTLATVVDLDAVDAIRAEPNGRSVFEREARAVLDGAAAGISGVDPATVILGGRPAEALVTYARSHDVDLIAIGQRGTGLAEAVLGSVAERLVRESGVLVLVAGRTVDAARRSTPVS